MILIFIAAVSLLGNNIVPVHLCPSGRPDNARSGGISVRAVGQSKFIRLGIHQMANKDRFVRFIPNNSQIVAIKCQVIVSRINVIPVSLHILKCPLGRGASRNFDFAFFSGKIPDCLKGTAILLRVSQQVFKLFVNNASCCSIPTFGRSGHQAAIELHFLLRAIVIVSESVSRICSGARQILTITIGDLDLVIAGLFYFQ